MTVKPVFLRLVTAFVLASCVVVIPAAANQHGATKTLYERLGGYDAIAAVTDDFILRLVGDASLSRFFTGHSNDSKAKIRQHVVDFVCKATGGPCVYTGRPMKVSHEGLALTKADWDTSVKLLVQSLDKFKVPAAEKTEFLAAVSALEADIVQAPAPKKH